MTLSPDTDTVWIGEPAVIVPAVAGFRGYRVSAEQWQFRLPIVDDGVHEPDESLTLVLGEPGPGVVLGARRSLAVTLKNAAPTVELRLHVDDDSIPFWPPQLDPFSSPPRVREGRGREWPFLEVIRRGDREPAVAVEVAATAGGVDASGQPLRAAVPGVDFVPVWERIAFATNDAGPYRIVIPILDDAEVTPLRVFTVSLTPESPEVTIRGGGLVMGISDNESPANLDVTHSAQKPPLILFERRDESWNRVVRRFADGNGGWWIAGNFASVNGVPRPGLARLNEQGELDESFAPEITTWEFLHYRQFILPLGSGGILVRESSGQLVRIAANGSVAARFSSPGQPSSSEIDRVIVDEVAELLDGTLLLAVRETGKKPDGTFVAQGEVRRVTADGVLLPPLRIPGTRHFEEPAFHVARNGTFFVNATLHRAPTPDDGANTRPESWRFRADGTRDETFSPLAGSVALVLSDQRLVVADYHSFALHHPDGTLDSSWPETVLGGVCLDSGPGFSTARENAGKLWISVVSSVDGWGPVDGTDPNWCGAGDVAFHLANAPKTALHWVANASVANGVGTGWRVPEPAGDEMHAFVISLRRLGSTAKSATVHYTTRDLTATAGKDYEPRSGTVTFGPLEVEKEIQIPILADAEDEFDEAFEVLVTAGEGFEVRKTPSNVDGLPTPMRLTILGNGPAPRLDRAQRLRDGRVLLGTTHGWPRNDDGTFKSVPLEYSPDLKTWHPLMNVVTGFGLDFLPVWLDASATNSSTRYYRAVVP